MAQSNCENCKLRAKYDQNPNSLLGRFWRWHINYCPGWKGYFTSLSDEKKAELRNKYNFLIYKRIYRQFDQSKTDKNGTDRYFEANSGNADRVESRLKQMNADYMILESDISDEAAVKEIYSKVLERYGRVDILVNNAADGDMDGIDTIEKITQKVIDNWFFSNFAIKC